MTNIYLKMNIDKNQLVVHVAWCSLLLSSARPDELSVRLGLDPNTISPLTSEPVWLLC